jgi:hypothetical protein
MVRPLPSRAFAALLLPFALAGCHPTAGYRTPPGGEAPTVTREVREPAGGPSLQPTPPHRRDGQAEAQPACTTNEDCVPATCCHPTACVPRAQAPNCADVMCTQECRAGTLDCGGRCTCEGGVCVAHVAR